MKWFLGFAEFDSGLPGTYAQVIVPLQVFNAPDRNGVELLIKTKIGWDVDLDKVKLHVMDWSECNA